MFIIKGLSIFILIFFYISVGAILRIISIFLKKGFFYRTVSLWTKFTTNNFNRILGIKINLENRLSLPQDTGYLIISNHVSYIDGLALASILPVIFVSKSSVKFWPLFGQMALIGATVFIDRQDKKKSVYSLKRMAEILKNKTNLMLFPEGTSTDGTKVLEFQSIFFQVPLETATPIIPITIQYTEIDDQKISLSNRDRVFWYGQKKFFWHFLSLLKLKKIKVKLTIHPHVNPSVFKNRKELSRYCREIILKGLSGAP